MINKIYAPDRRTWGLFLFLACFSPLLNAQTCLTNLGTGSSKVTVWLKPDNAVQSAGTVSAWNNAGYSSPLSQFALTSTGSTVTYQPVGLNFNPTVQFNAGQYLQASSVTRSSFMPDNSSWTMLSVHYAASAGIMVTHQTASSTQKFTHEIGGGFIGSSPTWFTFPTTGSASLTSILVNGGTVYPYGDGKVGTTIGNSALPDASNDLIIGAFRSGAYRMNGQAAEILMYNSALSASQRNQVESYLASKYGITLDQSAPQNYTASDGTVYWSAAANGVNNARITVIGRDDCFGFNQKQSVSSETGAMVTIGNGTTLSTSNVLNANSFAADKSFLAISDNNGSIAGWTTTGAPARRQIISRVWKVDKTNNVDSIRIRVPDNTSTATNKLPPKLTTVLLAVDADGDFTSGAIEKGMTLNGTNWERNYSFADGAYFTFITLAAGATLPVKFSSFTAQPVNGRVSLNWNVGVEEEVKGYDIERSADGRDFSSIGFVAAANKRGYSFADLSPLASAYYRIKSVNADGSYNVTNVSRVDGNKSKVITKAFFSGDQTITIQHDAAVQGSLIKVSAINGQLITTAVPQVGSQETLVKLPAATAKLYLVQYQKQDGRTETLKVVR